MRRRTLLRSGIALGASVAGAGLAAACTSASPSAGSNATLGPPETTTVRLAAGGPCDPAFWTAGDFLQEEGFTQYKVAANGIAAVTKGDADIGVGYSQWIITNVDAGKSVVALAGMHTGCAEVWTKPGIASISDLRGKTIAVNSTDVTDVFYGFWAAIFANVGIDPRRDVNFVLYPAEVSTLELFLQGQSDAILALAASGPTLRASPRNTGKLLISMQDDAPYKQYYCCQLIANRDWVRQNPSAAKRATRALLRANDRVAKDPAAGARAGFEQGLFGSTAYDVLMAVLRNCTFEWRDLDAQTSLRFFAVQLANQKLVKGSPQDLITQSSDYGYLAELRRQYPRAF